MAHSVNFDSNPHYLEAGIESPADEEGVHNSFNQLIQEQSHDLRRQSQDIELSQLDLEEESRDNVPYLAGPAHSRAALPEDHRQVDPLIGERWSSATLRILSSMPSRTIGRSRGAIISQYYNRTMQLRRRRQSRPDIRNFSRSARPSIRGYGVESDEIDGEAIKKERLVNNLQNLSASDRVRMLKGMPLHLAEKRELRTLASKAGSHSSVLNQIPCCSQLKYYLIIALRQGWYSWLSFLSSLQLWQIALKRVSGRFGTGVVSYFVFLRTLLFFNIFLFLVTGLFLVVPQAVRPPVFNHTSDGPSGLELITGAGYFTNSLMYYGYYTNSTLRKSCRSETSLQAVNQTSCEKPLSYNMPLAYFFTIGVAFFVTCLILVYSMSKSFGQSFCIIKSKGILAMKAFSSWDFKVTKKTSIVLQSENICTQLKELLAEVNHGKEKTTALERILRLSVHMLAWTICVFGTVGCALGVYYFSEYMHKDLQDRARSTDRSTRSMLVKEASLLALPVVVSSINLLLPGFFNLVAWMEVYDSPSVRNYVSIARNLMLKICVLGMLCYHWLGRIASDPSSLGLQCWESFVGQELYRFLLMDFIFTLLDTFFGEFLWRLFSRRVLKRKRKPVFDIARNVLELIYGQTLAWLGVLFTPLLPAVQILKLLILFYVKKTSLMMNCQASRKPWRASQMTTIFITLLCFPSFLGSAVCVTYAMWSIKPSKHCGPFRGLEKMFHSGKKWIDELSEADPKLKWLSGLHSYLVENPLFLFIAATVFLIVIYFHTQVVDGQRQIISLLQEQIENEGEDKKFLITKLQSIHEQKKPFSPRRIRGASEDSSYS
ncbi:transmembrane channel-like protein 6b [Chanos chanos]|uniref:Transmembrane channel-like protein n=1 Tax=Chanos chanos TaxID=29144 RepID=A0A6J2V5Y6_CHACN|nr:transmembrane channel-like protein 6 [Chanos chanos]XP_030627168.1 transmembrane channel-like protein 6 [Chanos chanos]